MIRLATIADAAELGALISSYDGTPAARATAWCREICGLSTGVVLIHYDRRNPTSENAGQFAPKIFGALALRRDHWGWNGAEFLRDDGFLCIDAGDGARSLIRVAVILARRLGLPLYLGQSSGARVAALARLYRQEGGEIVGSVACWKPAAPGAV